jgi:hypothetical protein
MKSALAVATCAAVGISAFAAVIVDNAGVGFVGKGDIQNAFGWNNQQLQDNAGNLEFRYVATESATWECEWWSGPDHNIKHHTIDREIVTSISASVAFDARKNRQNQITGFNLNGFEGDPVVIGGTDEIGHCEGNKTLVADSISYGESHGDGVVEVSDGNGWIAFDLPVDQGS